MTSDIKDVSVSGVLKSKLLQLGLYDECRVEELVSRIENDEDAMLLILGRLSVEEVRGGSGAQQCIRAIINTKAIPSALDTFDTLLTHELDDESFPVATPTPTTKPTPKTKPKRKRKSKPKGK